MGVASCGWKKGDSHSAVGIKKNTEDLGLPSPISAKESVNIVHVEVSHKILFGGERETQVTLSGPVGDQRGNVRPDHDAARAKERCRKHLLREISTSKGTARRVPPERKF